MATVVCVMDRANWAARTDIIVVADPVRRLLIWIPRDLWIEDLRNRINAAFARGGHDALCAGLASVGIEVEHSLCLHREATERVLRDAAVTVPVTQPMEYWYPLTPTTPIEDGRKLIRFDPPSETLTGERIHQWLGARSGPRNNTNDFHRIRRQQTFVRTLLLDGFNFGSVLDDPELVRISDASAIDELSEVRADWHFDTFDDLQFTQIDGMSVLALPAVNDNQRRGRAGIRRHWPFRLIVQNVDVIPIRSPLARLQQMKLV